MLLQAVHRRRQEAPVVLAGILLGFGCTAAGVLARGPTAGALVAAGLQVGDLAAPVFLACFLWALGRRFVRQQRRMRHLAVRVVDAHEAERKRIARDLHDGVAQSLAAAKLGLQLASSKAGPDRDISPDDVESALEQLDASIDELHDVAVGLRADVVAELELSEALQWYVGKTASAHGIRATVRSAGPVDAPLELRTHVFRVLQEAVANAIKHGRASELSVRVAADGRQLELVIRDNGAGFDTSNPSSHGGGIGLPSMKERAELLGGSLEVRSAPGRGCEVHLVAPLRFPPVTVAR